METIESPGKYLKARRESRRFSLTQVARATRIREVILKSLEEDKYEDLPHLYVKSFLGAYAGCLGFNPNEVILLHEKYVKNQTSKGQVSESHPASGKRRVKAPLLIIVVSGLLLSALLVFASFKLLPRVFSSSRPEESKPSSSFSAPSSPAAPKETEPPAAEQPETNEIRPSDTGMGKEP